MERSNLHPRSATLPNNEDPFRDQTPSSRSSISAVGSSSSEGIPTPPRLAEVPPARIRNPISTTFDRLPQSRYLPASPRNDIDEILPVESRSRYLRNLGPSTSPVVAGRREVRPSHGRSQSALSELVTRRTIPPPLDLRPETIKSGRRAITFTKWVFILVLLFANGGSIFATWWWPRYYYVFLPFITITVALNCVMVASVIFHTIFHAIKPEQEDIPDGPESMVLLLPCYNETLEELSKSLDSLVDQADIDEHRKAIMIVCDGKVRGPGMEKTTAAHLLDDILTGPCARESISDAYTSWDHTQMDVVVQRGSYKGIPYLCIIKEHNKGKRDGLILIRSFLYNFNIRHTHPVVIQSPYFFSLLVSFLRIGAGFDKVDILIGMDADTIFAPTCISELLKQSHYKNTVGVCGYVTVDFKDGSWSAWKLYQNAEYTISQCLRRLHQSIATHKVSCLPGCCQLLKISEATCGDHILLDLFGYHPTPKDSLLKQIRATASEDRNHVCLMLSAFPKARTRQALRAKAYTDVPRSWSVFLSQRRRWTLGATSNDLFLIFAPGVLLFERILALANVVTWVLNLFIIACIASFIKACTFVEYKLILAFASVMMVPLLYYIVIVIWQPQGVKQRVQYILGLSIYFFLGPFLNIIVLLNALWGIDNFSWGKTRKVIADPTEKEWVTEKLPPLAPELAARSGIVTQSPGTSLHRQSLGDEEAGTIRTIRIFRV